MAERPTPQLHLERLRETRSPVVVACRNNRKISGILKAFDSHFNVILEDAVEHRAQAPSQQKGRSRRRAREFQRHIKYLFVRGDSVVVIQGQVCPAEDEDEDKDKTKQE